ncbi:MAG: sulfatase-like hydrolase/transferase, partial [Anaerolineales bacterium]
MNENLSRRDFLKVTSLFLFSKTFPKFNVGKRLNFLNPSNRKNVLIIVFDALTANNISFLGYPRNTMTKLSHYIEKATVYHNNYSGGNFTTPGTGSLLTGTLPWTHRAFEKNDTVKYSLRKNNIFNIFGKENYYRFSYTHNPVAERLIMGFLNDIDDLIPRNQLFLNKDFVLEIFKNDYDIAALSRNQIVENPSQEIIKNSLFLPEIYNEIVLKSKGGENKKIIEKNLDQFPRGVPKLLESEYFLLEDGIDYLIENIGLFQEPFLGYFHFFPPHKPYSPRREFAYLFGNDEINIPEKPEHIFSRGFGEEETLSNRLFYDQYI